MKKYVVVTADTNDGDYITEIRTITLEEIAQLKVIIPKLTISYNVHRHWDTRWECSSNEDLATQVYKDVLSQEDFQLMQQIVPHGEHGVHSIESVDILIVAEEIKLL